MIVGQGPTALQVRTGGFFFWRFLLSFIVSLLGWSGGAKELGKLSVPGPHTYFDDSRARAYCACNKCGWGCLDIFSLVYPFPSLSHSLGDGTI